ncbi:MAG TPA: hypothetical protein VGR56_05070 [Nitrososphaerales archaeon]|nr:hypothetical protein [Nitrososphaerales archaeon]
MTRVGMGEFAGCSVEVAEVVDSVLGGIRKPVRHQDPTERASNVQHVQVATSEGPTHQSRAPSGALVAAATLREERAVAIQSIDNALDVMGRTWRDVFFEILDRRYGITKDWIAESPDRLRTTLKLIFANSASVIERYALREIKERTGVEASSLEEAVAMIETGEWLAPGTSMIKADSKYGFPKPRPGLITPK